ncbi:ABC transporter permease [Vibrio cholerae]|uniref:ABC transporter permease n=1 Tax=Vibrio cholerae TaxID=666 RepID=UPI002B29D5E3|nr:ABC transporter permease [Vibrio cholerae]
MNIITFISSNFNKAIKYKDIWLYLGKQDLNSQFRRSKLGIAWMIINQLSFSLGAGLIWAAVFGLNPVEFIPFISTGFAVWGFIAASYVDSCSVFHMSQGFIKQVNIPLTTYIFRHTYTSIIRFLIGISVALFITVISGHMSLIGFLMFIPGLLMIVILGFFSSYTMAFIGSRYRDVQHGLSNVFQLLFVLTPVIYPPQVLIDKGLGFAVYINPFTSIIEVVRKPLIEQTLASTLEYVLVLSYILIMIFFAYTLNRRMENKVVYYL